MPTSPTSPNNSSDKNTYIIDSENVAEMARLLHQDRILTKSMGGLWFEQPELSNSHDILDLACGPGGWALEVADTQRNMHVVGVDISEKMIEYARALARGQKLMNIEFRVMNILKSLDFPNDSFDLVNARLIYSFMPPNAWPTLIQECLRVCRPEGTIRLTESETAVTNSAGSEKILGMLNLALKRAGQSFSPEGQHAGIVAMLERFLHDAGCVNVQSKAYVLNFSAGMEAHSGWYENAMVGAHLLKPFLLTTGVTTTEEFDQVYGQMLRELQDEKFCGVQFFLTAWGKKAGTASS